jgi:very-short-patch-repair endonuclease
VGTNRARELRKKMTPPERRLWNMLRLRPDGFKFRRQHPIDYYTLDFYCYEAALCVEVDGFAHELGSNPQRDGRRDDWLASQGVATLRIAARDVRDNLEGVIEVILEACRQRSPSTSSAGPPPLAIEGEEKLTHGREEALKHWCLTHQIKACELNLVGYEDEDD